MKVYEVVKRGTGDFNSFHETSIKLSEMIKATNENERMKGFAFSTYAKLVYKAAGIKYKKPKSGSFRSTLSVDELTKVIEIEDKIIECLLLDMTYDEIKPELLKEVG